MSAINGMTTTLPISPHTPLNRLTNRLRGPAVNSGDVIWIEFPGVPPRNQLLWAEFNPSAAVKKNPLPQA
jgi:hypothetical protein